MNYSLMMVSCADIPDKESYLRNKIQHIMGDFSCAKGLASAMLEDIDPENRASFRFLSHNIDGTTAVAANSPFVRNGMACMLKTFVQPRNILEDGETVIATDFATYVGDSPTIPAGAGALHVLTNMAEFFIIDLDFIFEMPAELDTAGIVADLTLAMLKSFASRLGNHLGVTVLEQLGLAKKELSLDKLRRQLVADIEQKNVEQTLREQRGLFKSIAWDLTAMYPTIGAPDKLAFLRKKEELVSGCLGVLAEKEHCVPGAPDYLTCASLFLVIIQELLRTSKKDPYADDLYSASLERVLEPIKTIKKGLENKRRSYVGPVQGHRYNCAQCRGQVMCSFAKIFEDRKTGKWSWIYPKSGEKDKDYEARANDVRNDYLISLDRESDWVWDISRNWDAELAKCR